ncbi:MAG: hypothetical protein HDR24_02745 [Lachnospiraceae bacterium]|nr:hypothetical protein [Lachnospiraceae bacterium]
MMNFEEFTDAVLAEIQNKADGAFKVLIKNVTKNNGIKLTGITAEAEVCNVAPCVYLDNYYEEYGNGGMKLSEAVDEIYRLLKKHLDDAQSINISGFLDWETVKGSIYAKIVNAGQNKELLERTPYRLFLDMAVVYYVVIGGFAAEGTGTILIRNEHMEMWGQNEGDLYHAAISNMRSDGEPCFDSMETVIKNIILEATGFWKDREQQSDMGMYVLTNRHKFFGASEILDKNTLHSIADKIGDGFIVLPSSVHEVIILPPQNEKEYGKLAEMVQEVNRTQVSVEEQLSDHVYVYCGNENSLKVVA